jgi:hypothetical protein
LVRTARAWLSCGADHVVQFGQPVLEVSGAGMPTGYGALESLGCGTFPHREQAIYLPGQGAELVTRVTQARRREIASIVAHLPAPHRKWLVDALDAFSEAGGEPSVDGGDERRAGDWI